MKTTKRTCTVSVKGSRNFQSVSLTEGFEVDIDEKFNILDFENERNVVKERLINETQNFLDEFVEAQEISKNLEM